MIPTILIGAHLLAFNFAFTIGKMSYNKCRAYQFKDGIYVEKYAWGSKEKVKVRVEPLSCSQWLQLIPNRKKNCIAGYRCK